MRAMKQSLCVSLVLASLLNVTSAGQEPWYYHVNSAAALGNAGTAHQDYENPFPDPNGCWHNITDALNAIKADGYGGPWVVQVDDTARYDDAVTVWGFKTNATATLTLRKNPALKGRPTVYPAAQGKAAFYIGGDSQQDGENSYVTVQGFVMSNNASGTDRNTEAPVFADCQANLTTGRIVIEDCVFDGLGQTYDTRNTVMIYECRVDTVFRNNEVKNFIAKKKPAEPGPERNAGLLVLACRKAANIPGKRVQIVQNSFHDNVGILSEFSGDLGQKCGFALLYEGNRVYRNTSNPKIGVLLNIEGLHLDSIVVNNLFYDNAIPTGWQTTLLIYGATNTKIYHNTFFNNRAGREVVVGTGSTEGIEIKNNVFWSTAGSYCVEVQRGCTEHLISANNAFVTDFMKDGCPPGFGFSITENTEPVGLWNGKRMTTDAWNKASTNNTGNGYTLGGPGLDKNLHLVGGSPCIDRGVPALVSDDIDGEQRPLGAGFDIGADEYGTTGTVRSVGSEREPGQGGWRRVNTNGFGNSHNQAVSALAVFKGQLYAGTFNEAEGTQVWRSADGSTWSQASESGFGSAYRGVNIWVASFIEFKSQLYASTGWNNGQVWRSPDGLTWELVVSSGNSFVGFGVYGNMLYASSMRGDSGLGIWRSNTGTLDDWSQVVSNSLNGSRSVWNFVEFNGALYAPVENMTAGASIWRTTNGTTWTQANTTSLESSLNVRNNIATIAILKGYMYVGVRNHTTGAKVWRSNDGDTWTLVTGNGFGDSNNICVALAVLSGELYGVTLNSVTGSEVWRSNDGIAWQQINADGFGDRHNEGGELAVFMGSLYAGMWNSTNGGELWQLGH